MNGRTENDVRESFRDFVVTVARELRIDRAVQWIADHLPKR